MGGQQRLHHEAGYRGPLFCWILKHGLRTRDCWAALKLLRSHRCVLFATCKTKPLFQHELPRRNTLPLSSSAVRQPRGVSARTSRGRVRGTPEIMMDSFHMERGKVSESASESWVGCASHQTAHETSLGKVHSSRLTHLLTFLRVATSRISSKRRTCRRSNWYLQTVAQLAAQLSQTTSWTLPLPRTQTSIFKERMSAENDSSTLDSRLRCFTYAY